MEDRITIDGIGSSKPKREDSPSPTCFTSCFPVSRLEEEVPLGYNMSVYGFGESGQERKQRPGGGTQNNKKKSPQEQSRCFCTGTLESECCRQDTFKNWPSQSLVDFKKLAKAGFVYTGCGDEVVCVFCDTRISGWKAGDGVMAKHKERYSHCSFVQGESNNVPISNSVQHQTLLVNRMSRDEEPTLLNQGSPELMHYIQSREESQRDNIELPTGPSSVGTTGLESVEQRDHTVSFCPAALESSIFNPHEDSNYPEFVTESSRLASFSSWPANAPVNKESLARAGFFYIGISDHTKCFCCGQGLSQWDAGDDPISEHARFNPDCKFIKTYFGASLANC